MTRDNYDTSVFGLSGGRLMSKFDIIGIWHLRPMSPCSHMPASPKPVKFEWLTYLTPFQLPGKPSGGLSSSSQELSLCHSCFLTFKKWLRSKLGHCVWQLLFGMHVLTVLRYSWNKCSWPLTHSKQFQEQVANSSGAYPSLFIQEWKGKSILTEKKNGGSESIKIYTRQAGFFFFFNLPPRKLRRW